MLVIAVLGLAAAFLLQAAIARAVSEETIPSSTRSAAPRTSAAPITAPTVAPQPSTPSVESLPPAAPPATADSRPAQPRAFFPYFIRPGDTWNSIATTFGVAVPDLTRANRATELSELIAGHPIRIPNPSLARERELSAQVAQLTRDQQAAEQRARQAELALSVARGRVDELVALDRQTAQDVHNLAWWRGMSYILGFVAALLLGAMFVAVIDWWMLRSRFMAVAEMNEALRRLDYRYRNALAKAELRLQELYGRRRRGLHDGHERPKLAEEAEIESLNRELKVVLEHHLRRLGRGRGLTQRARWQARIDGIGSPVEPRALRR